MYLIFENMKYFLITFVIDEYFHVSRIKNSTDSILKQFYRESRTILNLENLFTQDITYDLTYKNNEST